MGEIFLLGHVLLLNTTDRGSSVVSSCSWWHCAGEDLSSAALGSVAASLHPSFNKRTYRLFCYSTQSSCCQHCKRSCSTQLLLLILSKKKKKQTSIKKTNLTVILNICRFYIPWLLSHCHCSDNWVLGVMGYQIPSPSHCWPSHALPPRMVPWGCSGLMLDMLGGNQNAFNVNDHCISRICARRHISEQQL